MVTAATAVRMLAPPRIEHAERAAERNEDERKLSGISVSTRSGADRIATMRRSR